MSLGGMAAGRRRYVDIGSASRLDATGPGGADGVGPGENVWRAGIPDAGG